MSSFTNEPRIHQARCGPLKLTVPTGLTLRQKAKRNAIQPSRLATFKGSLKIKNKGNGLVTFKVSSKNSKNLQVKPAHGLIESNQSISLNVLARNVFSFGNRVPNFGLLILATTCEVTDRSSRPEEIPLLWKEIIHEGACAFVDTFKIEDFYFIDIQGNFHEIHGENNSTDISDIDGYLSSSSYSSQHYTTDSEDGGLSPSQELVNRKKLQDTSLEEMNDLTKNIEETNETMRSWSRLLILVMIVTLLLFLQRSLGSLQVEIVLTQRGK